jgi:hypothetical protein
MGVARALIRRPLSIPTDWSPAVRPWEPGGTVTLCHCAIEWGSLFFFVRNNYRGSGGVASVPSR